ncbi:MAG: hypothetical protein Q8Q12_17680 [bacterium]|nr:hypothetical protein [bacterium]
MIWHKTAQAPIAGRPRGRSEPASLRKQGSVGRKLFGRVTAEDEDRTGGSVAEFRCGPRRLSSISQSPHLKQKEAKEVKL